MKRPNFDGGPLNYPIAMDIHGLTDEEWRAKQRSVHGIVDPEMRRVCMQLNDERRAAGFLAPVNGDVPEHLTIRDSTGRLI